MAGEEITIEQVDFPDLRFRHKVEDVRPGTAQANNGDALGGQFLVERADARAA